MKATKIIHKNEIRIKVDFPFDSKIATSLKQIKDTRWSKSLKAWHIPYSKEAFGELKKIFPEVEYQNKKQKTPEKEKPEIPIAAQEKNKKENELKTNIGISILVFGRRIAIKLPKNEIDIQFLKSFRFSRWDKNKFCWIVPNYPGHLDLLKDYFKERITKIEVNEDMEIDTSSIEDRKIGKNDLLIIKTSSGRLKLFFGFNEVLTRVIKSMPYFKWNKENKSWSIPFAEKYLNEIKLTAAAEKLNLIYEVEEAELNKKSRLSPIDNKNYRSCPEEYKLKLKELRYASSSIKTYIAHFTDFINYYGNLEIENIDEAKITEYLRYLVMDRKVSTSTQNIAINAIKFYYEKVLKGNRKIYLVDRPRKEKTLPNVLNDEEICNLFKSIDNIKHKCILMLAYSAGLRLGELINVKIKDIDPKRKQIRIEQGKGKKDRYSLLSTRLLELLRKYYKEYKPNEYLFEGSKGGQYSARSIQSIMKAAAKKAGIKKKVGVHTLRHTFATHLLENGTDIRYIQSLLGHESSKTTEIYTHVTTKGFDQIKSPLDNLDIF